MSKNRSPRKKVKSPKSFIKKIRSSSSLNAIPLIRTGSNLSQFSRSSKNIVEVESDNEYDEYENIGLNIDIEDEDLFGTLERISFTSSMDENNEKVKAKVKKKDKKKEIKRINELRKNQLYQEVPDDNFIDGIIDIFVGQNINNPHYQFSRKMLEEKRVIEQLNTKIDELKRYYLRCKHKKYLERIDSKKAITIFRQIIRLRGYRLESIEKYNNGSKYLLYHVERMIENQKSPRRDNFEIDFD